MTRRSSLHAALAGEVHVWFALASAPLDAAGLARADAVLSDEERARAGKFVFEEDARIYRMAHALVRATLSRYLDAPPASWSFRTNRYGRPEILAPVGAPALRFNLSHARGLVACAVSDGADVGMDVEGIRDVPELLEIAQRQFSPEEHAALVPLAPPARREAFFRYWTLKEAYIKARGMGLSLPTERFTLRFTEEGRIAVAIDPLLGDDGADWQFATSRPTADHAAAVAVRRGGRGDRRIIERWTAPLAAEDAAPG